ncbi:MAG: DUF2442 domain-containing protein [Tannerella sp.]|jgi:hypothetical protein|nr:DUF2442 domain-containing protein [Tannerella sp.]
MNIEKLWFADDKIFIFTDTGKQLWQSLLWYPRLLHASPEQRNNFEYDNIGIRWEEIDEDMSVESFLYDDPEPQRISRIFLTHPELNASAIARRIGIQQSLLASYIRGTKKPSATRENEIINVIREFGKELAAV